MDSGYTELLRLTQHAPRLDDASYVSWFAAIPYITAYMPRYEEAHRVSEEAWIAELLADAIDLADPDNSEMLQRHGERLASQIILGNGEAHMCPSVVRIFQHAAQIIAHTRSHHSFVKGSLAATLKIHPDAFRVAPLPHGLIIHQHHERTGHLEQVLAVGDCIGPLGAPRHPHRTYVTSHLEASHVLYALVESWRLGHGHARRYVCDLLRAACADEEHTSTGTLPDGT